MFLLQVHFLNDGIGVAVLEIREPNSLPLPLSISTEDISDMEKTEVLTVGCRHCGTLKMWNRDVTSSCKSRKEHWATTGRENV